MERRVFLAFSGGVAAWPLALHAQTAKATPLIGVLISGYPETVVKLLSEGLRALGYAEGSNIRMEVRNVADGNPDRLAAFARELVRMKVDLLVTVQTPAAQAAKGVTREIPIVISAGDPVGTGLIDSLARPGGNITGFSGTTAELGGKLLQLVQELLPAAKRVAVLANGKDPFTKSFLAQLQAPAQALGLEVQNFTMVRVEEYAPAFAQMSKQGFDVVIVQPSLARKAALELAHRHRLPAVSPSALFAAEGGLMSYSANAEENYRVMAAYVDKILKGTKPADLPVQQPTKFDLRFNLRTARALGITISPTLLARADRVIE